MPLPCGFGLSSESDKKGDKIMQAQQGVPSADEKPITPCPPNSGLAAQSFNMGGNGEVRVLLVSPFDEDHRLFARMLDQAKWETQTAKTLAQAKRLLEEEPVHVVVCERDLPDGTWREMLSTITSMRKAPKLIVASRLADTFLWAEALNLGAYDVLAKPFDPKEVLHVVGYAWLHWSKEPILPELTLRAASLG